MMAEEEVLLAQGAEARLFVGTFLGKQVVIKERFPKTYRHPDLDKKLTAERLSLEAKCIQRARRFGVDAPVVYFVDTVGRRIYMERIHGITAKAYLSSPDVTDDDKLQLARGIGVAIAKIHSAGMTHGDLTTSNIMLRGIPHVPGVDALTHEVASSASGRSYSVALIDFGLAQPQCNLEEKGVDLYVLERAITSGHKEGEADGFFEAILASYFENVADSSNISRKFEQVRSRGRKRLAFG